MIPILLLLFLFLPHSMRGKRPGSKTYVVRSGDTAYSIGKRFGIPFGEILSVNHKSANEPLYVGEKLELPLSHFGTSPGFSAPIHPMPQITRQFQTLPWIPHKGILFASGRNKTVYACQNGIVVSVDSMAGYGIYIIIEHSKGLSTVYGNLQKSYVRIGQKVKASEKLGLLHTKRGLYFQVNQDAKPLDPGNFLNIR